MNKNRKLYTFQLHLFIKKTAIIIHFCAAKVIGENYSCKSKRIFFSSHAIFFLVVIFLCFTLPKQTPPRPFLHQVFESKHFQ